MLQFKRVFMSVQYLLFNYYCCLGFGVAFVPTATLFGCRNSQLPVQRPQRHHQQQHLFSFIDRMDGESNDAYFRRVTAAASDPSTFERAVLQSNGQSESEQPSSPSHATHPTGESHASSTNGESTDTKQTGYVRVEVWEAEEQRRRKNGELTWEERVQFEGLRDGNGVNQNEILKHHLNGL